MFLPIETTDAEYLAMAEADDGLDDSDDDYDDETHDSCGRTTW